MVSWSQPLQHHAASNQTAGTDNVASGPILAVSLLRGFDTCALGNSGWVFPRSSTSVISAAPGTGETRKGKTWYQAPQLFGAVPASGVILSITVSGSSSDLPITLDTMKLNVVHRQPEFQGTVVDVAPEACQESGFQTATANLDNTPPTLKVPQDEILSQIEKTNLIKATPAVFPYTITKNDSVPFLLFIGTKNCDCSWTAEIDWTQGSKVGHTYIDDHGQPFETASVQGLPEITWTLTDEKWTRFTGNDVNNN